ncbi:MAG: hypothetical protein WAK58_00275 [Trebonia sp.]
MLVDLAELAALAEGERFARPVQGLSATGRGGCAGVRAICR